MVSFQKFACLTSDQLSLEILLQHVIDSCPSVPHASRLTSSDRSPSQPLPGC